MISTTTRRSPSTSSRPSRYSMVPSGEGLGGGAGASVWQPASNVAIMAVTKNGSGYVFMPNFLYLGNAQPGIQRPSVDFALYTPNEFADVCEQNAAPEHVRCGGGFWHRKDHRVSHGDCCQLSFWQAVSIMLRAQFPSPLKYILRRTTQWVDETILWRYS